MAGTVNFIKQLQERRKQGTKVDVDLEGGGEDEGNIGTRIRRLAGDSGAKPEARDVILLIFALGVFGVGQMKESILEDYFRKDRLSQVETELAGISEKVSVQERKLATYESFKSEIESYDRQVADFNEKLSLIKSVRIGRNSAVRMVDYIVKKMPTGVWLQSLDVKLSGATGGAGESGKFGDVSIEGLSETHQDVSKFLGELEGTSFFPEWQLSESQSTDITASLTQAGGTPAASPGSTTPVNAKKFTIKAPVVQL